MDLVLGLRRIESKDASFLKIFDVVLCMFIIQIAVYTLKDSTFLTSFYFLISIPVKTAICDMRCLSQILLLQFPLST